MSTFHITRTSQRSRKNPRVFNDNFWKLSIVNSKMLTDTNQTVTPSPEYKSVLKDPEPSRIDFFEEKKKH